MRRFAIVLALALGCAAAPPTHEFYTPRPRIVDARGMVATDAALATGVGRDVLARGGNAVDAAIATALALAVVHPAAGNLGGGGFLLARRNGATDALDFRETAPRAATRDMFAAHPEDAQTGARSAGVPGSVDGLYRAFTRLGSKRVAWKDLVAPAIVLAEEGFVVDPDLESFLKSEEGERLARFEGSRALFMPGGKLLAAGARWKNPDLGRVLRRIAAEGPKGFYEGPTAEAIVNETKAGGGLVTLEDLARYEAKWREPLVFTYRGRTILAMPPPSSGGVALAMMCHILEGWNLARAGWHSPEHVHLEAEAMRRAFAARNARLGDPDFVDNPLGELLGEGWARAQRATIAKDRATPSGEVAVAPREGMHTTHLSVIDAAGDAVALTTTINDWFGSGVTVRGAGFLLNDEMDDFAAVPGTANMYGLVQHEPNAVAPGKRMLSSMSPTIVLGPDGKVDLVTGAAGGPRIITAVFQVVSNVVDFGMNAQAAIEAPRVHMQHFPDVLAVEKGTLAPDVVRALEAMGYAVRAEDHLADAVAVGRDARGFVGAPEPRRPGGSALGP
jgi:gamma-glutamyltranspeptidase/glutathione hydrolase